MSQQRVQQVELLSSVNDLYGGVVVNIEKPMDSEVFSPLLRASMLHWRQQGKRAVWIKLPIEHVNLVEAAVKEGFRYHHAEPDYLMLVCWLPKTADTIPANASHRVGVGAFVMNSKREVLVVQENSGYFKGTGVWKLPTGVVDEGEDICTAAVREVKEETGIDTEFVEVLAFRQSHKSFFGKSDLLFICMLKPRTFHIEKQNLEIEAAQWMPIEDYAVQPFNQKQELFNYVAKICLSKSEKNYTGFSPLVTTTGSGKWMPVEDYAAQPFNQKQELFNYVAKICLSKSEKNYAGFSPLATTTGSGKTSYSTSIIKVSSKSNMIESCN
ncbi:nudix hydrolase 7-like isoform X24 [Quercus robur]|uniref:nudix hydrolase 7-like isoform X24 n=1 Tax=Quercus robur TaxID=38942 RepID=UPI00216168C7|nr:nudix hydrolase 7-like isoform X24 [Quercus robur]